MRVDDLHKRCPKCGQVKALADFGPAHKEPQGVQGYCRSCKKAFNATWRRNKEIREGAHDRDIRRAIEQRREEAELAKADAW